MPLQRKLSKRKKITRKSTRPQKPKRKSIKHKTKRRIIGGENPLINHNNNINTEATSALAAAVAAREEAQARFAAAQAHFEATINRESAEILNQLNDKDDIHDAHFIEYVLDTQIRCNYNHNDNEYIIKFSYLEDRRRIQYTIDLRQTDDTLLPMIRNPESIRVLSDFREHIGRALRIRIRDHFRRLEDRIRIRDHFRRLEDN